MRDAFVAALTLNIFHRYTDRIRMANIAQVVNVLQSMILTDTKGTGHMILTPTYHVFNMYKGFQEATYLPMDIKCDTMQVRENRTIPMISTSAAKETDGSIIISLANLYLDKAQDVEFSLDGTTVKTAIGQILTCKDIKDYNDFEHPETVKPTVFKCAKISGKIVKVKIPAKSIVVLNLK